MPNLVAIRQAQAQLLAAPNPAKFAGCLNAYVQQGHDAAELINFGAGELIGLILKRSGHPVCLDHVSRVLAKSGLLSDDVLNHIATGCILYNRFGAFLTLCQLRPAAMAERDNLIRWIGFIHEEQLVEWMDFMVGLALLNPALGENPASAEHALFVRASQRLNWKAAKRLVQLGMPASIWGSALLRMAVAEDVDLLIQRGARVADRSYGAIANALQRNDWSLVDHLLRIASEQGEPESFATIKQVVSRHPLPSHQSWDDLWAAYEASSTQNEEPGESD